MNTPNRKWQDIKTAPRDGTPILIYHRLPSYAGRSLEKELNILNVLFSDWSRF